MKVAICLFAVLASALAYVDVDWSKIQPKDVYAPLLKPLPSNIPRIIGGTEATRNSIPYQAATIIDGGGFCGGSLISQLWILTAAHCTSGARSIQVILGAHNVNQNEATQVVRLSSQIITHASYNAARISNDVAVVRLASAVTLGTTIQTIQLAPASSGTFVGSIGLLSGWGRTATSTGISPVLRRINLSIITNAVCANSFGSIVLASNICTNGQGPVGACNGDSGGPLVVNGVQVGVVSFGANGCVSNAPSVFARVSSFRTWISSNSGV